MGIAGFWRKTEENRIDLLELRFQQLPVSWEQAHISFRVDNQVAVQYINKGGGRKKRLNEETKLIWHFLESRGATGVASYIPSADNPADALTRRISKQDSVNWDAEWQLKPDLFCHICSVFNFQPEIDWFASPHNKQLPVFVSRFFENSALETDAFEQDWGEKKGFMFPPFILLSRVLRKIVKDGAQTLLIHPLWPSQLWWPTLLHHRCYFIDLPTAQHSLRLPQFPEMRHRLPQMKLQASVFTQ